MLNKIIACALAISIMSCGAKNDGEYTTPGGLKYTHAKVGTDMIQAGDFVEFALRVSSSDGDVLQEVMDGPGVPVIQIPTSTDDPKDKPDGLTQALATAAVGDTIVLTIPIDSLPANVRMSPKVKGFEYLTYMAVVKDARTEAEQKAKVEEQRLEMEAKVEADKARLPEVAELVKEKLALLKAGTLEMEDKGDGLRYHKISEGEGKEAAAGAMAAVHYYGVDMKGNMFDTSFKGGQPYPFQIGARRVIQGWDQGIPGMKVGEKGLLFIPYQMAYGEAGSGSIGKKADLVFYVELAQMM